jgi:hypothetical protein
MINLGDQCVVLKILFFVHAEIDRQVQEIQAKRKKLNETTTQQEKVPKI